MTDKTQGEKTIIRLGIFFLVFIVIPGFILSLIALRTAMHEEAFLEKQIQKTIKAELNQAVYSIQQLMVDIQKELDTTVPAIKNDEYKSMIISWDSSTSLVNVPFIFKRTGVFLWPDSNNYSDKDKFFISFNYDFFMDRKEVEVYRSISDDYIDEILSLKGPQQLLPKSAFRNESVRKLAESEFQQDTIIQQQVYSDLKQKGKMVPLRNIVSGNKNDVTVEAYSPQLSTYITESMRFSQIVETSMSGIIPRIVDQQMMLIYWKKHDKDHIIGCSIDMSCLADRIASVLPQFLNEVRFITVLDHNGRSILNNSSFVPKRWDRPFVAREINRYLPRWETAVYLVDPDAISSRAHITTLSMIFIAATLFITIMISGFVLLRTMSTQINAARQKSTFVTNVSHELKTPLTSIRIFAELLKEGRQPDTAKQQKYLGIILSEIERLTRLINNVLDFARMNKGTRKYNRKIYDCNDLCKELAENQRIRLEHNNFTFITSYAPVPLPVYIDPEAIKQALLNILSNAEKYSADHRWIRFSVCAENTCAVITIADRGIGIEQSEMEHIFKEFYRVDDSITAKVQGTGLGLTITRQILRDHQGTIRVQRNYPSGTQFTVTLPVVLEGKNETENTGC